MRGAVGQQLEASQDREIRESADSTPAKDQIALIMLLHGTPTQRAEALKYCALDPKIRAQVQSRRHRFWAFLLRNSVIHIKIPLLPLGARKWLGAKISETSTW